jgi:hypothetical protein
MSDINEFDKELDEEMTVTLELEDGTTVCKIFTIFDMNGKDYIALLPLDDEGNEIEDTVWFYGYSENPDDPNEEPELRYIESDDEYEAVCDRFDEYLDELEFDEDEN